MIIVNKCHGRDYKNNLDVKIWEVTMEVRIDKTIKIELQEREARRLIKLLDITCVGESDEMRKFRANLLSYLITTCK